MMKLFNSNKKINSLLATLPNSIIYLDYQITHDPLPHHSLKQLPAQVKDQMEELYTLIQKQPQRTIKPLLELIATYPNVPVFYNYLNVAYEMTDQPEKAYAVLTEVYQKHPDYLFARTNYAFYCLKNHHPERVPKLFDHKFDLKLLYPHRNVFHITEFTAFTTVMALYHHEIGHRQAAQEYYQILNKIAPHHHMTKTVKRHLYPNLLLKILLQLRRIWLRSRWRNLLKIKLTKPKSYSGYSKEF